MTHPRISQLRSQPELGEDRILHLQQLRTRQFARVGLGDPEAGLDRGRARRQHHHTVGQVPRFLDVMGKSAVPQREPARARIS
jgi:hypothetical protein